MTDQEVNKIIADYMGYPEHFLYSGLGFTASLDTLTPVWEKLEIKAFEFMIENSKYFTYLTLSSGEISKGVSDILEQAASHATANAILEIEDRCEERA